MKWYTKTHHDEGADASRYGRSQDDADLITKISEADDYKDFDDMHAKPRQQDKRDLKTVFQQNKVPLVVFGGQALLGLIMVGVAMNVVAQVGAGYIMEDE
eukprot:TRINITY_DN3271_c0_g1_i3.p1 TRINITY_DN3271_c0_g1~~TRINITY_DN3271_c0_g1_i3.p1  ORF type:complete len:100 (+),score=30.72 TRINITY_DN3271_c0_g1_i3:42-341(+)